MKKNGKKIILHFGLLFSTLPIYAQNQLDSVIHLQEDRVIKVSQKLDSSTGMWLKNYVLLDRKTNTLLDGTRQWSGFDRNNNEVLSIFSEWNKKTADWEKKEKTEWVFDDNNHLISSRESVYNQDEWQTQAFDTVWYNPDSVVTTSYIHTKPSSRNVRYLTQKGKEYLSINYHWSAKSETWHPWMKNTWNYRQDTILQESSSYQWKDGKWTPSERTTYLFKENITKSTGSISYIGSGAGWLPLSKNSGADFQDQHLRTDTSYRWYAEANRWLPDIIYRTYLNENNKETDYLILKVYRDTTTVQHERMTMYTDNGKVTLRQEIYFENNTPITGYQQTYRFDENENLLQYTTWELDVTTDEWNEKLQIDFIVRPDILQSVDGGSLVADTFQLGLYNVDGNKHAVSEATVYHFEHGNKKCHEQVLFYYSTAE